MASVTLAESAKLSQDDLVSGVIESIITVNPFFDIFPFDGIEGNALAYVRELLLGEVGVAGVGTAVSAAINPLTGATNAKAPATFTTVTSSLTTLLGDAEVNGLIQATRSNINDQKAIQVASKAKHLGRLYQFMMINGTGGANQFPGLLALCPASQKVSTGVDGGPVSFAVLDQAIDLVTDKDGIVDYIMMHARTLRSYYALLRALGGASINEVVHLPGGRTVPGYRGIPIFRNDWIPTNATKGVSTNTASIIVGTIDDGSRSHGISGLTAQDMAGIQVVEVGEAEDADATITRVKWYTGMALFSELGVAIADGVTN